MVNKNLLNTARELGKDLLKTVEHTEKKRTIKLKEETPKKVHTLPRQKPFTLEYLGGFTDELIKKTNERFKGSRINMPYKENGLVNQIGILDRLAMITTIYSDNHLQSAGLYPLSPLQSELLLKDGKIPNKSLKNDEYLALILYDLEGHNSKEAEAMKKALEDNYQNLGLNKKDLEKKLLIVNAGLEKDNNMKYGVKPKVLQGLTGVYPSNILNLDSKSSIWYKLVQHPFFYGLDKGLPLLQELGSGTKRTVSVPYGFKNLGLRVLSRVKNYYLDTLSSNLDNPFSNSIITFM